MQVTLSVKLCEKPHSVGKGLSLVVRISCMVFVRFSAPSAVCVFVRVCYRMFSARLIIPPTRTRIHTGTDNRPETHTCPTDPNSCCVERHSLTQTSNQQTLTHILHSSAFRTTMPHVLKHANAVLMLSCICTHTQTHDRHRWRENVFAPGLCRKFARKFPSQC